VNHRIFERILRSWVTPESTSLRVSALSKRSTPFPNEGVSLLGHGVLEIECHDTFPLVLDLLTASRVLAVR
jgi:hypothetical protein